MKELLRLKNAPNGCGAVLLENGGAETVAGDFPVTNTIRVLPADDCFLFPGFCDVHVHLREPGFCYKETIRTGTLAAARGGFTAVCAMPNLDPVPDCAAHLDEQLARIRASAAVRVYPYGAITRGEKGETLSDMDAMAEKAVAFSDDGRGVQSEETMRQAMRAATRLGKLVAAHCEDNSLLRGGCIHDGAYARAHGLPGICAESEWRQIERDLRLARETGCAYHVCHVSCRQSVKLIRRAKAEGVDVTCETAPHYLLLCDDMLRDEGAFKMNPPIRSEDDRQALLEGLADGAVDMIATDHAPHAASEKTGGLRGSVNGVVGLETAFPVLYTELVKKGALSLETLLERMVYAPRRRFGLPLESGDFTVFRLGGSETVNPEEFLSQGRSTPFAAWCVEARCLLTAVGGRVAWRDETLKGSE